VTDFPRQPKLVKIMVESDDLHDRDMATSNLMIYLKRSFDDVDLSRNGKSNIIRCYPRAVND
jgi:hypothetical protein